MLALHGYGDGPGPMLSDRFCSVNQSYALERKATAEPYLDFWK